MTPCRKCNRPFPSEDLGEGLCVQCWDREARGGVNDDLSPVVNLSRYANAAEGPMRWAK